MIDKYVKVGTTVTPRMQGMDCAVVIAIEQNPDTGNTVIFFKFTKTHSISA